ncbi:MAG: aminomethyl-transferring glycine dehydrogenase subunit GcvPA [Armatimonadota bacterium]
MSNYIPNTNADRQAMLAAVGVPSIDEFFRVVPEGQRFPELKLPPALSEMEALRELGRLQAMNANLRDRRCFLGAGAYHHFIPSVVDFIISRSEFFTSYTPYQPEVSQGTLQAHFEFQSMLVALTGMEVAIVSHYDGGTAVAEAVLMAVHGGRNRTKALISPTVHPQYREVTRTYLEGTNISIVGDDMAHDQVLSLGEMLDGETACLVVQNPDFLGRVYTPAEMQALADKAHAAGAMFIVSAYPISLGLLAPPGSYGADIAAGEAQPLGNPVAFGGPYLGYFTTKMEHVRRSPGRIVGQTVDVEGERGMVLTLSTREQHIRREKATSNICSNQALNALAAAVYMASLGKNGMRQVAELCYHKAHYAAELIGKLPGYEVVSGPFFNEFAVRCPRPVAETNAALLERGIVGGYDLGKDYPALDGHMLLCVTEMNTREDIEGLAQALGEMGQ